MFVGKHKPAFIGSICFLMSLVLSEFWVSLKETVLILGKKKKYKHTRARFSETFSGSTFPLICFWVSHTNSERVKHHVSIVSSS